MAVLNPDSLASPRRVLLIDGIELHDRLKEDAPRVLRRLVFSVGDIVSEEAAEFVISSSCVVLQKPFELAELRETVARIVETAFASPG